MVCKERNIVIESLNKDNILFIQKIQDDCGEPIWEYKSLLHLLESGQGYGCIAKKNSIPKGYILMRSLGDEDEILSFGVLNSIRRNGIGSILFKKIDEIILKSRKKRILLEVNKNNYKAILFYKKFGFKDLKVLKKYYNTDNGKEDGLLLSKVYFGDYNKKYS